MTRLAAVLGWPVSHSKSPAMHDAAFAALGLDAKMVAVAVAPDDLAAEVARLRRLPLLGASVTVPHKLAIVALCDELDPAAAAIGAVNCLVPSADRLIGHNTDAPGFHDALVAAGFATRGARAVVLGAGGAARAVGYALVHADAQVEIVARTPSPGVLPWTSVPELFAHADLVVDCTPTGLEAGSDVAFAEALPLARLPQHAWVCSLVYHRRTRLLELAAARGLVTLDGRDMLIRQAARAFTLWTGQAAPLEVMARAFDAA